MMIPTRLAVLLSLLIWVVTMEAFGQQYGQWTWDGRLGARHRSYDNTDGAATISRLRDRELTLALGINGFILHPAIAAFRIAAESSVLRQATTFDLSSNRIGYRGDLQLFPEGPYRLHVFAHHQTYSYGDVPSTTYLSGVPDRTTLFGFRSRVRAGRLSGLILNYDRTRIALVGPQHPAERHENQLADWSASSKQWQHHYRLRRQAHEYAVSRFRTDETSLEVDETYKTARWRWLFSSNLLRRDWQSNGETSAGANVVRVQNLLIYTISKTRSWDLQHTSGFTMAAASPLAQSHTLSGRYAMTTTKNVVFAPFASIGTQRVDGLDVIAPQIGAGVSWRRAIGSGEMVLSAQSGYQNVQTRSQAGSMTQSSMSSSAGASLSQSAPFGLQSQGEVSVYRNALRSAGDAIAASTTLIPLGGTGTEDRTHGRITVGRRWRSVGLNAYSDWMEQHATSSVQTNAFAARTWTQSLQLSAWRFGAALSTGSASLEQALHQELKFTSGSATLRVGRSLSLIILHRSDIRNARGEPPIDGRRTEGGLSIRFGAYTIDPHAFMATERARGGQPRTNRGLTVVIGRDFGGLLPIVSGVQRRGVVR